MATEKKSNAGGSPVVQISPGVYQVKTLPKTNEDIDYFRPYKSAKAYLDDDRNLCEAAEDK